ncbi:MAG: gamma-glutamyl-gamma-aminobutyrate hydrolase family protein [Burkholderiales bacterium]|nr:type 1 glutamine amidotransferase [Burkholderiales bacterium]MDE1929886.1 gamma-glutamyl-gamma-aminobutyrate hydrolase family protein [Burkholderiales bacterium]MDE2160718.1 gamma-glutamyl-gamma-aminobutyrate hydrolase family protein [Burkholderiales bacterium]MDE2504166.1 gamma-glutamyl-gamma-aminobutyrate hydrolase family protein [Burkholderiales bacterium]
MDRPLLIGVSARIFYPGAAGMPAQGVWTRTLHYLEQSVAHWLLGGGAMAVMVPAVDATSVVLRSDLDLHDYAAALDGLVLQGGNDVAPETYGETPGHADWQGDRTRDRYEIDLLRAFVAAGKPVFGICRGLQLLNVAWGGTLLQDIPTLHPTEVAHHVHGLYERHRHEIEFVPGTRLASLYPGQARSRTNSIHHQAIKDLAREFTVEARCPQDGLIEAVRWSGPSFVAGVQWHPEFHPPGAADTLDDRPLLQDFLAAARAAAAA